MGNKQPKANIWNASQWDREQIHKRDVESANSWNAAAWDRAQIHKRDVESANSWNAAAWDRTQIRKRDMESANSWNAAAWDRKDMQDSSKVQGGNLNKPNSEPGPIWSADMAGLSDLAVQEKDMQDYRIWMAMSLR